MILDGAKTVLFSTGSETYLRPTLSRNRWVPETFTTGQSDGTVRLTTYLCVFGTVTRWRSCLKHCPTGRNVAGSIPLLSLGYFFDLNVPAALCPRASTLPLSELSTRDILWNNQQMQLYAVNFIPLLGAVEWNWLHTAASVGYFVECYDARNNKYKIPGISSGEEGDQCVGMTTLLHSCADWL